MTAPSDAGRAGDVYPVGVLRTLLAAWRLATLPDFHGRRVSMIRREFRKQWRYIVGYCIKGRRWRALRNTFNGYLCEHDGHPHNCGRGWTKRAAIRRASRMCTTPTDPEATL